MTQGMNHTTDFWEKSRGGQKATGALRRGGVLNLKFQKKIVRFVYCFLSCGINRKQRNALTRAGVRDLF
jgi:hypothetical protein